MKNKLITILSIVSLLFTGCEALKTATKPATTIAVTQLVENHKVSLSDLEYLADRLEVLAKSLNRTATIEDFSNIIQNKNSKELSILVSYIYDIYKDKIVLSPAIENSRLVLLDIISGIRDGIRLNTPDK